jgi:lipid-A-disaccharide synthase
MYGAHLIEEILKLKKDSPIEIDAIGSKRLRAAGARIVADSSKWGAMGILQSIKVGPRVLLGYLKAKKAMKKGEVGLFVPIDFGGMNMKLARYARQLEWKVLYFMPPGSWRRTSQGEGLAEVTDEVVTPFSWSAGYLNSSGVRAHYFGHPLKQIIDQYEERIEKDLDRVAILPGSRKHEIKANLRAIAKASKQLPNSAIVEFALSPNVNRAHVAQMWEKLLKRRVQTIYTQGDTIGVLKRARVAVVCSGTATLEAALCGCPMVVIYRLTKMMALEAKLLKIKPTFIALPNIVLNRRVVPELIQEDASPNAIASWLLRLGADGADRVGQLSGFDSVDEALGDYDAITQTAALAYKLMSRI